MNKFAKAVIALGILVLVSGSAHSDDKNKNKNDGTSLHAQLKGFQEVPSVSTVATGELTARINPGDASIDYTITYSGLQGNVTQSHIHIGQRSVNGGIVLWFCQTATNPGPAGTPTCTNGSGTFSGTFTSANVVAIGGANVGQQVNAGDFAKVVAALRGGVAYANVHTVLSTGGEIRGQIKVVRGDKD